MNQEILALANAMKTNKDSTNLKNIVRVVKKINPPLITEMPSNNEAIFRLLESLPDFSESDASLVFEKLLKKIPSIENTYADYLPESEDQAQIENEPMHPVIEHLKEMSPEQIRELQQRTFEKMQAMTPDQQQRILEVSHELFKRISPEELEAIQRMSMPRAQPTVAKNYPQPADEVKMDDEPAKKLQEDIINPFFQPVSQSQPSKRRSNSEDAITCLATALLLAITMKILKEMGRFILDGANTGINVVHQPLSTVFGDNITTELASCLFVLFAVKMIAKQAEPRVRNFCQNVNNTVNMFNAVNTLNERKHEEKDEEDSSNQLASK